MLSPSQPANEFPLTTCLLRIFVFRVDFFLESQVPMLNGLHRSRSQIVKVCFKGDNPPVSTYATATTESAKSRRIRSPLFLNLSKVRFYWVVTCRNLAKSIDEEVKGAGHVHQTEKSICNYDETAMPVTCRTSHNTLIPFSARGTTQNLPSISWAGSQPGSFRIAASEIYNRIAQTWLWAVVSRYPRALS